MSRVLVLAGLLAASVTLAACAGAGGDGNGGEQGIADERRDTAAPAPPSAAATPAAVTIHMTGLLLVVPPKRRGDSVHVVLPKESSHVALLGFGMTGDSTSYAKQLCEDDLLGTAARAKAICYVNLDDWTWAGFGAGGTPTDPANGLPAGLVNVSTGAGKQHKVHVPWLNGQFRSHVVFEAGKPGGSVCSLSSWSYQEVDENGTPQTAKRHHTVNLMDWVIQNPASGKLVFVRNTGQRDTIIVPGPALEDDNTSELLLAHVPAGERKDLPPNRAGRPPAPNNTADHFDAYYSLLRKPGTRPEPIPAGDVRRRIPSEPRDLKDRPCPVRITSALLSRTQRRAVGTYACMIATADPLP